LLKGRIEIIDKIVKIIEKCIRYFEYNSLYILFNIRHQSPIENKLSQIPYWVSFDIIFSKYNPIEET